MFHELWRERTVVGNGQVENLFETEYLHGTFMDPRQKHWVGQKAGNWINFKSYLDLEAYPNPTASAECFDLSVQVLRGKKRFLI